MYNMSMLRHRLSNEWYGGGGGGRGALNHLPLLFCKSVYYNYPESTNSANYVQGLIAKEQQILVLLYQAIHVAIILIIIIYNLTLLQT